MRKHWAILSILAVIALGFSLLPPQGFAAIDSATAVAVWLFSVSSISNGKTIRRHWQNDQAVIQRKPNVATYHNSLAGVYVMLERYPEAIQQYQNALRLKPYEPRFYLNLSKAYRLIGAAAEAEKAHQEYERLTSQSK